MDFRFSPEDEAFRQEVRAFVQREWDDQGFDFNSVLTASWHRDDVQAHEVVNQLEKKLVAKGWYTMHWPTEYGGGNAPIGRQLVYVEEMAYQGAPVALGGGFFAHTLMQHGQEWQRREFLPKIARADLELAQGFSEPNAGSDLASLQTRAVRDGDNYVVNGQKIWQTSAHYPLSTWGHFLVRTDPNVPKHRGISYLLIEMDSPGLTKRPLYDLLGRRRWSEIFLDNVRVPTRNLIGEENRGWYAAMTTLSYERTNVEIQARLRHTLDKFIAWASHGPGRHIIQDPIVRHHLAEMRIRLEAARMLCYQVAWSQSKGEMPTRHVSEAMLLSTTMEQTVSRTLGRFLSHEGQLLPGDPRAPMGGFTGANQVLCITRTIGGGTAEVQRNIVAQRGLGLPR